MEFRARDDVGIETVVVLGRIVEDAGAAAEEPAGDDGAQEIELITLYSVRNSEDPPALVVHETAVVPLEPLGLRVGAVVQVRLQAIDCHGQRARSLPVRVTVETAAPAPRDARRLAAISSASEDLALAKAEWRALWDAASLTTMPSDTQLVSMAEAAERCATLLERAALHCDAARAACPMPRAAYLSLAVVSSLARCAALREAQEAQSQRFPSHPSTRPPPTATVPASYRALGSAIDNVDRALQTVAAAEQLDVALVRCARLRSAARSLQELTGAVAKGSHARWSAEIGALRADLETLSHRRPRDAVLLRLLRQLRESERAAAADRGIAAERTLLDRGLKWSQGDLRAAAGSAAVVVDRDVREIDPLALLTDLESQIAADTRAPSRGGAQHPESDGDERGSPNDRQELRAVRGALCLLSEYARYAHRPERGRNLEIVASATRAMTAFRLDNSADRHKLQHGIAAVRTIVAHERAATALSESLSVSAEDQLAFSQASEAASDAGMRATRWIAARDRSRRLARVAQSVASLTPVSAHHLQAAAQQAAHVADGLEGDSGELLEQRTRLGKTLAEASKALRSVVSAQEQALHAAHEQLRTLLANAHATAPVAENDFAPNDAGTAQREERMAAEHKKLLQELESVRGSHADVGAALEEAATRSDLSAAEFAELAEQERQLINDLQAAGASLANLAPAVRALLDIENRAQDLAEAERRTAAAPASTGEELTTLSEQRQALHRRGRELADDLASIEESLSAAAPAVLSAFWEATETSEEVLFSQDAAAAAAAERNTKAAQQAGRDAASALDRLQKHVRAAYGAAQQALLAHESALAGQASGLSDLAHARRALEDAAAQISRGETSAAQGAHARAGSSLANALRRLRAAGAAGVFSEPMAATGAGRRWTVPTRGDGTTARTETAATRLRSLRVPEIYRDLVRFYLERLDSSATAPSGDDDTIDSVENDGPR